MYLRFTYMKQKKIVVYDSTAIYPKVLLSS